MPHIIVTAGNAAHPDTEVMLRERINATDFESERFTANLIERIEWAVTDAVEAEQQQPRKLEADKLNEARGPRELVEA